MRSDEILRQLKSLSNPKAVAGMARLGISPKRTYGISIQTLRAASKLPRLDSGFRRNMQRMRRQTDVMTGLLNGVTASLIRR